MRILVDLAEPHVAALNDLSGQDKRPRAALIREAVELYLSKRRAGPGESAFGLWGDRAVDGLEYERKARSEW